MSTPIERRRLGPALVELTDGDRRRDHRRHARAATVRQRRRRGRRGARGSAIRHRCPSPVGRGRHRGRAAGPVRHPRRARVGRLQRPHDRSRVPDRRRLGVSDALFRYIGDDERTAPPGTASTPSRRTSHYLLEVDVHEPLRITTQLLGRRSQALHLYHEMFHGDDRQAAVHHRADARARRHERGSIRRRSCPDVAPRSRRSSTRMPRCPCRLRSAASCDCRRRRG